MSSYRGWSHYRPYIVGGVFVVVLFLGLMPNASPGRNVVHILKSPSNTTPRQAAANKTLGFQHLLAVSVAPSWRTRGLKAAADLTGLEFTVPPQPHNPEELVEAFEKIGAEEGAKVPAHGSATAWFSHIDMLKYVIASGFETAFIVEDDVDWDVRIKDQIQLVSDNVRNYTKTPATDPAPYGLDWDVLWLGHCGSAIFENMPEPRLFADDTRCKTELYSGWSKHFLRDHLAENYRFLQVSQMTVCTFGYGVNKQSAQKVLDVTAKGANEAFDVALSGACASRALRCLVVNPQIMNHYEPPPEFGYLSDVHVGDGQGGPGKEAEFEFLKGTTGNIMESARCKALWNEPCMRPPSEI